MFATPAMAQATTPAADGAGGFLAGPIGGMLPIVAMVALFYFLLIRPQQRRMKQHQQMVAAVKRGDTVVMSSGMIGKVTKVDDAEVTVEIAPSVNVRVIKAMISEVRSKGEPAPANDSKS